METIAKIRRDYFVEKKSIKAIARDRGVSRNTVRKVLRSGETAFHYARESQPLPRLEAYRARLEQLLAENETKARRERLTLVRVFELLQAEGFAGSDDAVRRYARRWRQARGSLQAAAFVPLVFAQGEAYQFDWSHEIVVIGGVTTAVDAVFAGKARRFNRRFLQMCSHYLVEPVACTPAAGWEKGQVENQVGVVRQRLFTPRLRFPSYAELNAWLLERCIAYARSKAHPEQPERRTFEVFEDERAMVVPYAGPFDGYRASVAAVSKTCLVRFDHNRYSSRPASSAVRSMTTALLDRLTHHCDIIETGNESWRFKHRE